MSNHPHWFLHESFTAHLLRTRTARCILVTLGIALCVLLAIWSTTP